MCVFTLWGNNTKHSTQQQQKSPACCSYIQQQATIELTNKYIFEFTTKVSRVMESCVWFLLLLLFEGKGARCLGFLVASFVGDFFFQVKRGKWLFSFFFGFVLGRSVFFR